MAEETKTNANPKTVITAENALVVIAQELRKMNKHLEGIENVLNARFAEEFGGGIHIG